MGETLPTWGCLWVSDYPHTDEPSHMEVAMQFTLRKKVYTGNSHEELSRKYCELRDARNEGASTFPTATIVDDAGVEIGRLSYNGRVWGPGEWVPGAEPLYCPSWGRQ